MPNKYKDIIEELETLLNIKNTNKYSELTIEQKNSLLEKVNNTLICLKPIIDKLIE